LNEVLGRVLREDARATEDMPASIVRRWTLRAWLEDNSPRFRIWADSAAQRQRSEWAGRVSRISPARKFPRRVASADAGTHPRRGKFHRAAATQPFYEHRRRGEDARRGALLLKAGTRLAGELALLASLVSHSRASRRRAASRISSPATNWLTRARTCAGTNPRF